MPHVLILFIFLTGCVTTQKEVSTPSNCPGFIKVHYLDLPIAPTYTPRWTQPARIRIDASVPKSVKREILHAVNQINEEMNQDLIIIDQTSESIITYTDKGFPAGQLGHTYTYENNGVIYRAEIRINSNYKYPLVLPVSPNPLRLRPVIIHELGHALGLDHSDYYESMMFPSAQAVSEGFSLQDKENLSCAYK